MKAISAILMVRLRIPTVELTCSPFLDRPAGRHPILLSRSPFLDRLAG